MHVSYSFLVFLLTLCACSSENNTGTNESKNILTVASAEDPTSLDPRYVRDLAGSSLMRMLYEGLMTVSIDGKVVPGIAENYSVSDDQKTYTFKLRPSTWADGSPLTSADFIETWKTVLSPAFPAPNAYQLFLIIGAKKAKEGKISVDEIGIRTPDSQTLIVELEQPAPFFVEMTACHFFFPVHPAMRSNPEGGHERLIGNGPFKLDKWNKRSELLLSKNTLYWNENKVALPGISVQILDELTAFQLFKAGELDWAGSPLSTLPQDVITTLKDQNKLLISKGAGTHWFRLNTTKAPFNDPKMRRAFALAIDRKSIVDHVTQGGQDPALGIIPPSFGLPSQKYFSDNDTTEAQALFNVALADARITKSELPTIYLSYASNDRNHKIAQAVQHQWNTVFGINVVLNGNESKMQLDKVRNSDYQIALGSWYADIQDPINFLEIFKFKENPTNQTLWHNEEYTNLLSQSSLEPDPAKRQALLMAAEKILVNEMPVIPLFHSSYNYLKNAQVKNVYFSPLGYIDLKEADKK